MARIYDETITNDFSYLTNFATNYRLCNPVADFVAAPFRVKHQEGKYVEYDKTQFRIWDDKISGEETSKEIQWDVDESTYACEEYGMAKFVSDKKAAQAISVIKLKQDTTKMLKQFHALAREYRVNQIAGNNAIVTQTANIASAWNTAAGTPITNIYTAIETVVNSTGCFRPNKIVLPMRVALKMIQTTEWTTQFRGTEVGFKNGLWSAVSGLRHMGLEPMLTNVQGLSEYKCTASDPTTESIWDDNVLVFYGENAPSLDSRTFMYSPYVKMNQMYETRVPRRRGVYLDIYSDIDELLVDAQCAYLLTNTL
jgi:hypothetical protein